MKHKIYLIDNGSGQEAHRILFPTGEKHIRIPNLLPNHDVTIVANDPSGDLMRIGMAVDICHRADVLGMSLLMPFVPYARQDQVYVNGDPLSIKVFADFINSMQFDKVTIVDPHSNVTSALINDVKVVPQYEPAISAVLMAQVASHEPLALVAPDLGAAKKIKQLQSRFQYQFGELLPVIQCDKTRDPETGKITGFKLLDGKPHGHHCLIVDDICDGGGTFLGIHGALKKIGVINQSLYVTHGIFSKGISELSGKFVKIFTTNSLPITRGTTVIDLGEYV